MVQIQNVIYDLKASLVFLGSDSAAIITQHQIPKRDNDKQHTLFIL